MLVSAGARHRHSSVTAKGPVVDVVGLTCPRVLPRTPNGELIDIKICFPSKKSNTPNVAVRAPPERPCEGIFKRIEPNKNLFPTAPRKIEDVASRKLDNLKSGSHGGASSTQPDAGPIAQQQLAKEGSDVGDDEARERWPGR